MTIGCPICGAPRTDSFWGRVWNGTGKEMRQCPGCHSYFYWPPNTAEEQAAFDRGYDQYIASRAAQVAQHSETSFGDLVDQSIAERHADLKPWFEGVSSVLEVGAERGGFLDLLRGQVPTLVGVDACPAYVEALRAKGYTAYDYLESVPLTQPFERICLFSLLEHVPEPIDFLIAARRRLSAGGMLVIEVPSSREPLVGLYDLAAFKDFYFQAMHPFVYSPEAVEMMLGRAGLSLVRFQYKQRYGLANHLQWLRSGLPGGAEEFSRIFDGQADQAYRRALETAGQTDTLYAIAKIS